MADFDKISINTTYYNVKDTLARQQIEQLTGDVEQFESVKDEQPIPITRYGAVGNGATDCSNAFDAAIDTGNEIFVPAGTYLISRPILLKDGQTLRGQGPGCTIIKAAAGFTGGAVVSTKKFDSINNIDNGDATAGFNTIRDISIDGSAWNPYEIPVQTDAVTQPTVSAGGLFLAGTGFVVENVKIWNCGTTCLYLNRRQSHNWNTPMNALSKFSNIDIGIAGQHAIELSGPQNTDSQWVNVHCANGSAIQNNTHHNLYIHSGANGKFTNCHFASQYGHKKPARSVDIEDTATACCFENCDIEGASYCNLYVGSSGNLFNNCRFYAFFGTDGSNVLFGKASSNNTFTGCTFSGPASDEIFTGSLSWDISAVGGGAPGSNHHNAFTACVTSNEKIAYCNSQWSNTVFEMRCMATSSNFTFESQASNRALITGGSNQVVNWGATA